MNQSGFLPNMSSMFHDVEKDEREHSEKLEIIFWLLKTYPGTYTLVNKNLRVCDDYNSAIKFISNLPYPKTITRGMNCFHHLKDGHCSCGLLVILFQKRNIRALGMTLIYACSFASHLERHIRYSISTLHAIINN